MNDVVSSVGVCFILSLQLVSLLAVFLRKIIPTLCFFEIRMVWKDTSKTGTCNNFGETIHIKRRNNFVNIRCTFHLLKCPDNFSLRSINMLVPGME